MEPYQHLVFFTGAGMSVESGIPTYRGAGGVWAQYRYQEYACQEAFEQNPEKVWDFHDQRREKIAGCQPNRGHRIIAAAETFYPRVTVITQNIDGLHQRAGSTRVIELHGSIWRLRCEATDEVVENFELPLGNRHTSAGTYWRPDIVWFGDPLREETINEAVAALGDCDLFLSIGTSAVVYPAARLPLIAMERGARTIEINPEATPLSQHYRESRRQKAAIALAELFPQLMDSRIAG
ncbi:MAG: NAD-dependent deacylase [Deltaproteobacteria bacterium]|nr:NAD-dependent deacylase [Candidatus Anaeroferrophillus wilburensis]MBN2889249.1 NAD-dependent deacylase [Deltaproteobacteria bacterium]